MDIHKCGSWRHSVAFLNRASHSSILLLCKSEKFVMYAALLKSLDSITLKKRRSHTPSNGFGTAENTNIEEQHEGGREGGGGGGEGTKKRRLWLTEASLIRLTEKILNNTENSLTSSSKVNHFNVDATKLDSR